VGRRGGFVGSGSRGGGRDGGRGGGGVVLGWVCVVLVLAGEGDELRSSRWWWRRGRGRVVVTQAAGQASAEGGGEVLYVEVGAAATAGRSGRALVFCYS